MRRIKQLLRNAWLKFPVNRRRKQSRSTTTTADESQSAMKEENQSWVKSQEEKLRDDKSDDEQVTASFQNEPQSLSYDGDKWSIFGSDDGKCMTGTSSGEDKDVSSDDSRHPPNNSRSNEEKLSLCEGYNVPKSLSETDNLTKPLANEDYVYNLPKSRGLNASDDYDEDIKTLSNTDNSMMPFCDEAPRNSRNKKKLARYVPMQHDDREVTRNSLLNNDKSTELFSNNDYVTYDKPKMIISMIDSLPNDVKVMAPFCDGSSITQSNYYGTPRSLMTSEPISLRLLSNIGNPPKTDQSNKNETNHIYYDDYDQVINSLSIEKQNNDLPTSPTPLVHIDSSEEHWFDVERVHKLSENLVQNGDGSNTPPKIDYTPPVVDNTLPVVDNTVPVVDNTLPEINNTNENFEHYDEETGGHSALNTSLLEFLEETEAANVIEEEPDISETFTNIPENSIEKDCNGATGGLPHLGIFRKSSAEHEQNVEIKSKDAFTNFPENSVEKDCNGASGGLPHLGIFRKSSVEYNQNKKQIKTKLKNDQPKVIFIIPIGPESLNKKKGTISTVFGNKNIFGMWYNPDGSGNCFFCAVSYAQILSESKHLGLRVELLLYILKNGGNKDILNKVKELDMSISDDAIEIFARMKGVNINIHDCQDKNWLVFWGNDNALDDESVYIAAYTSGSKSENGKLIKECHDFVLLFDDPKRIDMDRVKKCVTYVSSSKIEMLDAQTQKTAVLDLMTSILKRREKMVGKMEEFHQEMQCAKEAIVDLLDYVRENGILTNADIKEFLELVREYY